jgi:hypothetical protein
VEFDIVPTQALDGRMVSILVGRVVAHSCHDRLDGEWR